MTSGRRLALAKFLMATLLGTALYRLAPNVPYRVLALALALAVTFDLVVTDLFRPFAPTRRIVRACACCVLVVAFAPWRIAGVALCIAVFGLVGIAARARAQEIPRVLLWLSPLLLGVATWLLPRSP